MADKKAAASEPAGDPPIAELRNGYLRVTSPNPCSVMVQSRDTWVQWHAALAGPREIKGNIAVRDEVTKGVVNVPCTMRVEFKGVRNG